MLPPLLLAVGVADTMHVLVEYQAYVHGARDRIEAMRKACRELMEPLFLTTLTTAIGMLSLSISRVEAIREFGYFAAFGVTAAFLLTVTFVPIAISYLPKPRERKHEDLLSARFLEGVHRFTMRHSRAIIITATMLVAGAALATTQVRAESAFLKIFKPSAQVRLDTEKIQDALGGIVTLEVMVDTGREGGVKDPEVLRQLEKLETFLESQPTVSSAQSIADYFKDLRRAFFDNDQREYRLPETREEAAQYLLLYEMDKPDGDIREYVTFDYRQTRVSARVALASSNASVELVNKTQAYIDREFPSEMTATIAGLSQLYANMEEYIRSSMIQGFGSAFVGILIVFWIQLRSIPLGTIVMIPHLMPIAITLGLMGLTGIRLDSTTTMVASVAIGLADDDSIHFVSRVGAKLRAGVDMVEALRAALVEVGRALFYTTVALCAGFGVMLTSSFMGAVYFGLLVMITMILALAADVLVLPVMLRWYDSTTRGAGFLKREKKDQRSQENQPPRASWVSQRDS
jgi:predicted RND superfamily exporter protein